MAYIPSTQQYFCPPCNTTFKEKKSLTRHLRENKRHNLGIVVQETWNCESCEKTFTRSFDLLRHRREQHGTGKEPCRRCGKVLRQNTPHNDGSGNLCVSLKRHAETSSQLVVSQKKPKFHNDQDDFDSKARFDLEDLSAPILLPWKTDLSPKGMRPLDRSIPCGICRTPFPARQYRALKKHLDDHFDELRHSHRCGECQIDFQHKADLDSHLNSARRGDCGFLFKHTTPCNGHHPPLNGNDSTTRGDKAKLTTPDRFSFCFRVRHWEQAQQQRFMHSIDTIRNSLHSRRSALSDGYRTAHNSWKSTMSEPAHVCYGLRRTDKLTTGAIVQMNMPNPSNAPPVSRSVLFSTGTDFDLNQALLRAICSGHLELVIPYLDGGADICYIDREGWQPIHYAAAFSTPDMIEFLLREGSDISAEDEDHRTPLSHAIIENRVDNIEALIAKQAPITAEHMRIALREKLFSVAELLLERLRSSDRCADTPVNWTSVFMGVVASGNTAFAKIFLDARLIIGNLDSALEDALDHALDHRQLDIANLILSHMTNPSQCSQDALFRILMASPLKVNLDFVEKAIGHLSSTSRTSVWARTINKWIFHYEHGLQPMSEIIKVFLRHGVNIDTILRGIDGVTALSKSLFWHHYELADFLVEVGGNLNISCGYSPLQAIVETGDLDLLCKYLRKGLKPHLRDSEGRSGLHYAVRNRHISVTQKLLAMEVDGDDSVEQESVVQLAIATGQPEILTMLLDAWKMPPEPTFLKDIEEFRDHDCALFNGYHCYCSYCKRQRTNLNPEEDNMSLAAQMEMIIQKQR